MKDTSDDVVEWCNKTWWSGDCVGREGGGERATLGCVLPSLHPLVEVETARQQEHRSGRLCVPVNHHACGRLAALDIRRATDSNPSWSEAPRPPWPLSRSLNPRTPEGATNDVHELRWGLFARYLLSIAFDPGCVSWCDLPARLRGANVPGQNSGHHNGWSTDAQSGRHPRPSGQDGYRGHPLLSLPSDDRPHRPVQPILACSNRRCMRGTPMSP